MHKTLTQHLPGAKHPSRHWAWACAASLISLMPAAQAQTVWSSNPAQTTASRPQQGVGAVYGTQRSESCADCGFVLAVSRTERAPDYTALAAGTAAAVGSLTASSHPPGVARGAAVAAYAGQVAAAALNQIWRVRVGYPNGSSREFDSMQDPGLQPGDRVRSSGQGLQRQ